jgi:hypothetical protein
MSTYYYTYVFSRCYARMQDEATAALVNEFAPICHYIRMKKFAHATAYV